MIFALLYPPMLAQIILKGKFIKTRQIKVLNNFTLTPIILPMLAPIFHIF